MFGSNIRFFLVKAHSHRGLDLVALIQSHYSCVLPFPFCLLNHPLLVESKESHFWPTVTGSFPRRWPFHAEMVWCSRRAGEPKKRWGTLFYLLMVGCGYLVLIHGWRWISLLLINAMNSRIRSYLYILIADEWLIKNQNNVMNLRFVSFLSPANLANIQLRELWIIMIFYRDNMD